MIRRFAGSLATLSCAVLICAFMAQGAIIATDNFTYSLGELSGNNGGTGWNSAWSSDTGVTQVVDPGTPLTYSVPGDGAFQGGNRAVQVDGNSDNAIYRSFSSFSGTDLFFSFLIRVEAGSVLNPNDFASFWFDNVATGSHNGVPSIGVKADGGDGSITSDVMSRVQLGSEAYSTPLSTGTTYFIVGHLFKSNPAGNFDRFEHWVNPTFSSQGSPLATSSGVGTQSSLSILGLRSANLDPGDSILFDQVTLGTEWADVVTGIPEPALTWIAGGLLLGLGFFKRSSFPRR